MIKIKIIPSFHCASFISLTENIISYEIHPMLHNLRGLDKKEKLSPSEYLKLKEIKKLNEEARKKHYVEEKELPKSTLAKLKKMKELINYMIQNPMVDERIILDGVKVEIEVFQNNLQLNHFDFRSPENTSKEFEIISHLFLILTECFTDAPISHHLESLQGYFGIGQQWKITSENPLTLRLFGGLSIFEKEEVDKVFHSGL